MIVVDRLWYASWIVKLVVYAVVDYSVIIRTGKAQKLLPGGSISLYRVELESNNSFCDDESPPMRGWDDI